MDTYDRYVRDEFGKQFVHNIRYSDIQAFYAYFLKSQGLSIKTIAHVQNQIYPALEMAVRDGLIRDPFYLPRFSKHIFRHIFCTRICERDVNIKVIQTVMGHSSIKIIMDIYTEVSQAKQIEEINKMAQELDVFREVSKTLRFQD